MNINTSSEQPDAEPGSTTDLHPREQLDQLFLRVESRLQHVMRKHRRLSPTLFTVSPEGLSIYAPGPLNEVPEKNGFAADARLICASQGSVAAVLAFEAWALEAKPGEQ